MGKIKDRFSIQEQQIHEQLQTHNQAVVELLTIYLSSLKDYNFVDTDRENGLVVVYNGAYYLLSAFKGEIKLTPHELTDEYDESTLLLLQTVLQLLVEQRLIEIERKSDNWQARMEYMQAYDEVINLPNSDQTMILRALTQLIRDSIKSEA